MKDTKDLNDALKPHRDLDEFLEQNKEEFVTLTVAEGLARMFKECQIKKAEVIRKSGLDRTYAYQILRGERAPSRDKLIAFAFGMELSFSDAQRLLKYTGAVPLYAKKRRDSIIIYALENHLSIVEANILLDSKGESPLE